MSAKDRFPGSSPVLTHANIFIDRAQRRLALFNDRQPLLQFPVAIGRPHTPTPAGSYHISSKIINPGGVLGTRWLGLFDSYGIHGTNAPWLIGKMVSRGCIRMYNSDVEQLFALVGLGTPVIIR